MGKYKAAGGEDTRGAKSKAQKAEARNEKDLKTKAEKERLADQSWQKGANKRAEKRQQASEDKDEAKKIREMEKKALLAQEELELSAMRAPKGKTRKGQRAKKKKGNDLSMLDDFLAQEKKEKVQKQKARNKVTDMQVLAKNSNKQKTLDEAKGIFSGTGVDNALSALKISTASDSKVADRNPEKRMKGAYLAFEERRMAEMKVDQPGLKRSQYKDKLWKEWQKSAENPMNQE